MSDERRTRHSLSRIADHLGVPLATFFDNVSPAESASELADTSELLRLWAMIRTRTDRTKVLAFARQLASRSESED